MTDFVEVDGIGKVYPDPKFFNMSEVDQVKAMGSLIETAKKSGLYQQPTKPQPVAALPQNPQEGAAESRALFAKSAVDTVKGIAHTVMHPIETAENFGTIGKGILQKVGVMQGSDAIPAANAVGKALVDRYGSWDAISKTAHEDPVGFLMDVSTVLSGGAGAAKMAGATGDVVNTISKVGEAANPVAMAGRVAAPIVKGVGNVAAQAAGLATGAGVEAIKTAARAGAEGGEAGAAFRAGMSGSDMASVVSEAKSAVSQLRVERGAAYKAGMAKIGADTEALDFTKIDNAVSKVSEVKKYKGQDLSPATQDIRTQMTQAVDDWKALPKNEFHTAEGLDALKQKLGDIRDGTQPNTPARVIADQIYQGVRQTIIDQAPEYAKVMKGYEEASSLVREIEKTLSLNPKASVDTSLRKLQSVLRNDVSTNYGRRADLIDFLSRAGAPHLMEKLSGQMLSAAAPRGLSRVIAGGEGLSAIGALAAGHPGVAAGLGAGLLASSPALVGGAAYGLGSATRLPLSQAGLAAFQANRANGLRP